jgi:glyoxylase-like metal-dependent hydrolase (beta-lactamase superfamily II)
MIHRFQVGAMAATIVSDGPLRLHRPETIFRGPEKAAMAAALTASGQPSDRVFVEQNCLILETGGRTVLFDNGMGSSKLYGEYSGKLLDSLREAGYAPGDIDAVVLTHAHSDHCWGTMADDGTPNFPNATLYLSEDELSFWAGDPAGPGMAEITEGFRRHVLPLRNRISLVRDGQSFLPGVHAMATPGHTPGHMVYAFDGGWCFTGDVAFHDPLSYAFPEAACVYDTEPDVGQKTRLKLLDWLVHDRIGIIGYHHPWPGLGRLERSGRSFRFIPGQD